MTPNINPNGRIAGTRTSVYDIVPYLEGGRFTLEEIAQHTAISMEELQVALKYIEENRDEVMRVNREIDERHARGNPPEIQVKIEQASANAKKFREWLAVRRKQTGYATEKREPGTLMREFKEWQTQQL
jgi:uncharacterized protein (DUF433 family)